MMSHRMCSLIATFFTASVFSGCEKGDLNPGDMVKREGQPEIAVVAKGDSKIEEAIQDARSNIDLFISSLR